MIYYFGAQSHGLHPHYTRLHTPRYRGARGFATVLLARRWTGRTRITSFTDWVTSMSFKTSSVHSLISGFARRENLDSR